MMRQSTKVSTTDNSVMQIDESKERINHNNQASLDFNVTHKDELYLTPCRWTTNGWLESFNQLLGNMLSKEIITHT
jgi:hypothetical protein